MSKRTIRMGIEGGVLCGMTFAAALFAPVSMAQAASHQVMAEVITTTFAAVVSVLLALRPSQHPAETRPAGAVSAAKPATGAI